MGPHRKQGLRWSFLDRRMYAWSSRPRIGPSTPSPPPLPLVSPSAYPILVIMPIL